MDDAEKQQQHIDRLCSVTLESANTDLRDVFRSGRYDTDMWLRQIERTMQKLLLIRPGTSSARDFSRGTATQAVCEALTDVEITSSIALQKFMELEHMIRAVQYMLDRVPAPKMRG
jgi:hypothetical protein